MERKQRHCENRNETVYAGTLIGREDLPPANRTVGQNHSHVERNHRSKDGVEVLPRDHFFRVSNSSVSDLAVEGSKWHWDVNSKGE